MAHMRPLDPAPTAALPGDQWELVATEAGRYADGLRATVQVWHGTLHTSQLLSLAQPKCWPPFAEEVATSAGCTADDVVQALLTLIPAVEGALRQPAAHTPRATRVGESPLPSAEAPTEAIASQGLVKTLADEIRTTDHFAQDAGDKLYRYRRGVYMPDGEASVKRHVKALLAKWDLSHEWSSHRAEEVVEYLRVDAPVLWERPPLDRLNLKNGLLDLDTGELLDHAPEHLSSVQLPVEYYARASFPAWEKFVGEAFPPDAQDLAWEIIAWLMTPDTSRQKAILLEGEGGNGKSTFLQAVIAFAGRHNVSSLSLQKLEADRFTAARLVGKLANTCPDLPSDHLAGTSVFKAITGGDMITAEYKYHDSFEFIPFARLVFSANHLPRSGDGSAAFFDRWLVIPFRRSLRGTAQEIPRAERDARLADPQELSGVLNKALSALPRVREHGFTLSPSMRQAAAEFRQITDPLGVWLDRTTIEHPDAMISKEALVQAYNADCDQEGRPRYPRMPLVAPWGAYASTFKRPNGPGRDNRRYGCGSDWGSNHTPRDDRRHKYLTGFTGFTEFPDLL
jgi:P4 family phage/plasmid primase-like protien